jgi:predicted NACHT family NTPase
MVLGQPGAGKSMLLKFLTLSYAENRLLNVAE